MGISKFVCCGPIVLSTDCVAAFPGSLVRVVYCFLYCVCVGVVWLHGSAPCLGAVWFWQVVFASMVLATGWCAGAVGIIFLVFCSFALPAC